MIAFTDYDRPMPPTQSGRSVRALLAALLLEPGRVVSVESLKDALWGGAPPVSAQEAERASAIAELGALFR